MYCKNCGRIVDDNSSYCSNCGARLDSISMSNASKDSSNFGFALLGFFIPLVGLILFLIYEGKKPKRAKSAGKGALIGFITKIVLYILLFTVALFFSVRDNRANIASLQEFAQESTESILEKYADVSFGDFKITNNGYYSDTSVEVTVKNKATSQYSYYITIEAVDKNGTRLDTDTVYAEKLNAGQSIKLTAFEFVDKEQIDEFKNASFKVLEIKKYNS